MAHWLRKIWHNEGQAPSPALYRLADATRVYAIGDVHGRADLLEEMLAQIADDKKDTDTRVVLVMIGDLIDRGSQSRQTVDLVKNAEGFDEVIYIRGNHEQALLDFLDDPTNHPEWLGYGGDVACESYGVKARDAGGFGRSLEALSAEMNVAVDDAGQRDFLLSSKLYWQCGDYLFVHAGVRRGVPIEHQLPQDLLFIRDAFLGQPHDMKARIVFGHTPMDEPLLADDRIGLDTGAYRTNCLTCAVIEQDWVRILQTRKERN